jgi:hypothetical protein
MDIKTIEQLMQVDERIGLFVHLRRSNESITFAPHDAESIQQMIARCDLVPDVPERVLHQFETCRKLHTYGCFAYDFFAAAAERAYLVLEVALGARFVEHYQNEIPLVDETGRSNTLHAAYFSDVDAAMRRGGRYPYRGGRKTGWVVQGHPSFNASMAALIDWADREGLLDGQSIRVTLGAIRLLRNFAAHPHHLLILRPSDSARTIADLAEIINHLWGRDTPGGRLYGTPPEVDLFAIRWAADESRLSCSARQLSGVPEEDRDGTWFLVEGAVQDDMLSWHPEYEVTAYPTKLTWTGNSWDEAVAEVLRYEASGRRPEPRPWRNRLFLVRCTPTQQGRPLAGCHSPDRFRWLPTAERNLPSTSWWIVRADHPEHVADAWRDRATVPQGLLTQLRESELFRARVELRDATWEDAARRLDQLEQRD